MKSAIITGANGFIGRHLCEELLNRNIQVFAIVRKRESLKDLGDRKKIEIIEASMGEYEKLIPKLMNKADVFYQLAWEGASGIILSDVEVQSKNILYACKTLEFANQINCKRFIYAGTINELEVFQYMNAEKNRPRPASIYGISKFASEMMCKTRANQLNIVYNTAILGSIFGPGDRSKRIHNVFISNMLDNKKPKLVEGNNLHDWVYVKEATEMLFFLGNKSVNLKNYYIGHNKLRVFREILEEVRNILNPSMKLEFGGIKYDFMIDYSLVDINAIYCDTEYTCAEQNNFCDEILATAEWVKTLNFGE